MMKKHGSAIWQGDLKGGKGEISTQSGALSAQPYGFGQRFEDKPGTNPEELIGAAHAACFSMALANILSQEGINPEKIETKSSIKLEKRDGGFEITAAHLETTISADGDEEAIMKAARTAETDCPVSKLLNCEITMDARVG